MKKIIFIVAFLVSTLAFTQNNVISGTVNDSEFNNEPLIHAKVSIKEIGAETFTNEEGFYSFNNIEAGEYTLVFSFIGYDSIEKQTTISHNTSITESVSLGSSSLGMDEIMSALASADKDNASSNSGIN